MIRSSAAFGLAAALLATTAFAQVDPAPTGTSKPQPTPIVDTIAPAKDVAYPGTITLKVDATDVIHGIFRTTETIPVTPGALTLLFPKWLPGNHSPSGVIDKMAGLTITTADGKTIPWKRDMVDVFAFHLDVPAGTTAITATFQYLSPTAENQGRVVMTPEMLNLQWDSVALYPAGYFTRGILIKPSAVYPEGWTSATALRPSGPSTAKGGLVDYAPVAFDTLVDSPVFAGKFARTETLSPQVTLNVFADKAADLAITPEELKIHKDLVAQATKLYGAQHYDHYDFLLALTDRLGGIGLEHHRSSENSHDTDYFTKWKDNASGRDLLAHEYTHSWDGKFRRGADLWTPDYRTPMRNTYLWVYEGQTQFWGKVLAARSGLMSHDEALDVLAATAASYEYLPGRAWRPLIDTVNDEIINPRRPMAYRSYSRFEDYYEEGALIWLEADGIIREQSKGRKSLDDFAKAFFGVKDGDWGELTYDFDEIVATLNKVQPYDWATFLHQRVDEVRPHAPLEGITKGGYKLVFTDEPGTVWTSGEKKRHAINLTYSLGLTVGKDGMVGSVMWDSPAFKAGITPGTKLVAIAGQAYADDDLKDAVTAAKGTSTPIQLLIKQGDAFRTVDVVWNGGLRYPHLEKVTKGPSSLDALYAPRK
ncbi:M61 family metallopeptidase [Sphingomonas sp. AP4-R1]|uniref:M61 family metallopeptidase n=1 Tax=Sphingomonas sp. AP4-R1 TaxID=2735134 RepID=UPI001493B5A6|nr:M61 family metallopeptidase [Sphingomonas sp. AP4-R1]QJU56933.1 M61 family metallopeptidase [Sphingomonas sp. AP4-R1]